MDISIDSNTFSEEVPFSERPDVSHLQMYEVVPASTGCPRKLVRKCHATVIKIHSESESESILPAIDLTNEEL